MVTNHDKNPTSIYEEGSSNTNADALSRIRINSDLLKEIVPSTKKKGMESIKKALAKARGMFAKNKSDQNNFLNIRKSTSINDINGSKKIEFKIDGGTKEYNY